MKSTGFIQPIACTADVYACRFLFWVRAVASGALGTFFVIAGSSRGRGNTLLNFYPDHDEFLAGAVARRSGGSGVLLSSGRREAVLVWRWLRGLLITSTQLGIVIAGCAVILAGWRPGQRRRAGAAAGGHRRADPG